jgi:hypothetical protein
MHPHGFSETADRLLVSLRSRDGADDVDGINDELVRADKAAGTKNRAMARLQLPEVRRTMIRLAKEPKEYALWSRLVQRVLGYAVGLFEVCRQLCL